MKTLRHRRKWVRLLEAIYKGKVLNNEATAALTKQLSTLKQSYIPRLLPENVQVANKPGELEAVRTDSGIVFAAVRDLRNDCLRSRRARGRAYGSLRAICPSYPARDTNESFIASRGKWI